MRRLLITVVFGLAIVLSVHLLRPVPPGHFGLVYVYEANTHTSDDNLLESRGGAMTPVIYVDSGRLYARGNTSPTQLTCLAAITEVSSAGGSPPQGLARSVSPFLTVKVGQAGSSHRLLEGRVLLKVVDSTGAVLVRFGGLSHTIAAGSSWSVATSDRTGLTGVYEDSSPEYQQIMEAAFDGAVASRLMVHNHGVWDCKDVTVSGL